MAFRSWRSFWDFRREMLKGPRYVRSEAAEAFLHEVAKSSKSRKSPLKAGTILWRAQVGHDWRPEPQIQDEIPCAFSKDRMKPLERKAREGRVNPKGVPCLYLASHEHTAIAEARPGIGAYVSVAQFKTTHELALMNCSVNPKGFSIYLKEPKAAERAKSVWSDIDRAFAEPIQASDESADYAATQVLAELFRREGCDGVVYKSAFGESGYNIALFDLNAARLVNCVLHQVKDISLKYSEADYRYFVDDGD